jgi:hypothetical protein
MRNSFLLILSLIILSSFSMEPTYKGELNWRVCGIYNALKNNYPIVKAALLDYIITDSLAGHFKMYRSWALQSVPPRYL